MKRCGKYYELACRCDTWGLLGNWVVACVAYQSEPEGGRQDVVGFFVVVFVCFRLNVYMLHTPIWIWWCRSFPRWLLETSFVCSSLVAPPWQLHTPKLSLPQWLNNFQPLSRTHRSLLSTILARRGRQNWKFKEIREVGVWGVAVLLITALTRQRSNI